MWKCLLGLSAYGAYRVSLGFVASVSSLRASKSPQKALGGLGTQELLSPFRRWVRSLSTSDC